MAAVTPKKELGQHWLHDAGVLESIAAFAQVKVGDNVLEIGPGLGTLTEVLLAKGAHVTAVEFDTALARQLAKKHAQSSQLHIIEADILRFDFSTLPKGYKIVANIPYYLTSHLLRILGETAYKPACAALLMQKEVAERVCAGAGNMSILSVCTQVFYETQLGPVVPAHLFTPPPKVDSQVLILTSRVQPLIPQNLQKNFFKVVKAGFSEKRKMLRSSLSGGLQISKSEAEALLIKSDIEPTKRAQELTLEQWHALASNYTL